MQDIPQPEVPETAYPWSTTDAKREDRDWENESLLTGQETRNQFNLLKAYGYAIVVFLGFFVILFLGSLGSWTAHYLLPVSYHWLTAEQLSKIQSVLFSGSIGGVVSIVAQKHLRK